MPFFPTELIPENYFADGDRVFVRSKGELVRYSLVDFLNNIRPVSSGLPYHVNPDKPGSYETPQDAIDAADAELPGDEPIILTFDPNRSYTTGITLPLRHVFFRATAEYNNKEGVAAIGGNTLPKLVGNIIIPVADSAPNRRIISFEGMAINGKIFGNSNSLLYFKNSFFENASPFVTRTHGANGCMFFADTLASNNGQFWIDDQDDAPSQTQGRVFIRDSTLSFFPSAKFLSVRAVLCELYNVQLVIQNFFISGFVLIDGNSKSNTFEFFDVSIENLNLGASSDTILFQNIGSSQIEWKDVQISDLVLSLDLVGGSGTHILGPRIHGPVAPVAPMAGAVWFDTTAFALKMWTGAAWV